MRDLESIGKTRIEAETPGLQPSKATLAYLHALSINTTPTSPLILHAPSVVIAANGKIFISEQFQDSLFEMDSKIIDSFNDSATEHASLPTKTPNVRPTKYPSGSAGESLQLVSKAEQADLCSTATVPGDVSAPISSEVAEESGDSGLREGPGMNIMRGCNSSSEAVSNSSDDGELTNNPGQPNTGMSSIVAQIEDADNDQSQSTSSEELAAVVLPITNSDAQPTVHWQQAVGTQPDVSTETPAKGNKPGAGKSETKRLKAVETSAVKPTEEEGDTQHTVTLCHTPLQGNNGIWAEETCKGHQHRDITTLLHQNNHQDDATSDVTTTNSTVGEPPPEDLQFQNELDVAMVTIGPGPLIFIQQLSVMVPQLPPQPPSPAQYPSPPEVWCIPVQEKEKGRNKPTHGTCATIV